MSQEPDPLIPQTIVKIMKSWFGKDRREWNEFDQYIDWDDLLYRCYNQIGRSKSAMELDMAMAYAWLAVRHMQLHFPQYTNHPSLPHMIKQIRSKATERQIALKMIGAE